MLQECLSLLVSFRTQFTPKKKKKQDTLTCVRQLKEVTHRTLEDENVHVRGKKKQS